MWTDTQGGLVDCAVKGDLEGATGGTTVACHLIKDLCVTDQGCSDSLGTKPPGPGLACTWASNICSALLVALMVSPGQAKGLSCCSCVVQPHTGRACGCAQLIASSTASARTSESALLRSAAVWQRANELIGRANELIGSACQ